MLKLNSLKKILCFFGIHDYEAAVDVKYSQETKKYKYLYWNQCQRCDYKQKVTEVEKSKYLKTKLVGRTINETAVKCVLCGKKLNRKRGQIVMFCCEAHRKIYRGGRKNREKYGDLKTFIMNKRGKDAKKAEESQKEIPKCEDAESGRGGNSVPEAGA